jgi:UPF0271 protein
MMSQSGLQIDLNCDLGEYDDPALDDNDAAIMPHISSCNIAGGGHAGNQRVIEHTVELARRHGVSLGAHPGYPDRQQFGRVPMTLPLEALRDSVLEQIDCVSTAVEKAGDRLQHVKPHGALYNEAAADPALARQLVSWIQLVSPDLMVYGLAHSAMCDACEELGMRFVAEGFADRAYQVNQQLVPRNQPGAVVEDPERIIRQATDMISQQSIQSISGESIQLKVDTMCLHGDHPQAVQQASLLNQALRAAGIDIRSPA